MLRACASSVYQASPRGEGPGDEASNIYDYQELDSAPNSDSLFPVPLVDLLSMLWAG